MHSILRRHKGDNKSVSGTTVTGGDPAATSPASTVYHDPINAGDEQNHVMIHEPTPDYEPRQQPGFPEPKHYPADNKVVVPSTNPVSSLSPGSHLNSYPSSVNSDTVLGQQNADVKRSGTWAKGPGTSGLREDLLSSGHPSRHASLAERATTASRAISPEKETILTKAEMKDAKRLSKIIKAEGKAEDKQLKSALKELSSLQHAQKKASAAETAAIHAQVKAAKEEQRAAAAYLEAKVRLEKAQSSLKVCEERLILTKNNAEKTTGMVRRQADDVEALREQKATDDREREVKLAALAAKMVPS